MVWAEKLPVKRDYGLNVNENCFIYYTYRPSDSQVFQKLGFNDPQVLLDKITISEHSKPITPQLSLYT